MTSQNLKLDFSANTSWSQILNLSLGDQKETDNIVNSGPWGLIKMGEGLIGK